MRKREREKDREGFEKERESERVGVEKKTGRVWEVVKGRESKGEKREIRGEGERER